jgi:hypothetical protein
MTRMTGQRGLIVSLGLAAATAVLAVGTALAHGGYGPGHGMGCGAGKAVRQAPGRVPAVGQAAVLAMERKAAARVPDRVCARAWGRGMGRVRVVA